MHRQPSHRLRQISRLLSRQPGQEDQEVDVVLSCPLLLLLLLPLLSCLGLLGLGLTTVLLCPSSWLPIWLLLLGMLLPATAGLLSCSPDPNQPLLTCTSRALLVVAMAGVSWCVLWIYWVAAEEECLLYLTLMVRVVLVVVPLLCALIYWGHQVHVQPHRVLPMHM